MSEGLGGGMRVVFMGTGEIGAGVLRMLLGRAGCEVVGVVTQPDRSAGRGMELRESMIKAMAIAAGVPVLQPERLREAGAVAELAALMPDLIIVMAYGQILPPAVLELPRLACWNLHASLLPRWRGAAPIQAAVAAGDTESGVTVMHMAEGLDTGDIILKRTIAIPADETGGTLHDRLAELAPGALGEAMDLVSGGRIPRIAQEQRDVTVTRKLTREDGRMDWSRGAVELERFVRAMNPWPGAWCDVEVGGEVRRLKVFRAEVFSGDEGVRGGGGEVIPLPEVEGVAVGTGAGILILREVQAEGRRRMEAAEWLRGLRLKGGGR